MLSRSIIIGCAFLLIFAGFSYAQDAENDQLSPPEMQDQDTVSTNTEVSVTTGMDSALAQANQAFLALYNRQFLLAKQQYEAAASSNAEYDKMAQFCQNILDRLREVYDEYMEIYGKTMSQTFRIEQLTKAEVDRMLDFQMRQNEAGQTLGEIGLIADIPVSDLGLDFEGSDQLSLAEYVMWVKPRSTNERIWQRARKRSLKRSLTFAKQEIKQQQRQEHFSRLEEARRRRLDRQGQGNMGVGGGMASGGDFGGGGGGMGGMGGGMMGGGMGGGMMGGGMGGF